ncbi:RDD family protein [Mycobacterium kansasii 732]|nr:RDD family protein [Mycobacterium kansasii 732]
MTGDAVVLDVQIAQLPVRAVSAIIDMTVMFIGYLLGLMLWAAALSQLDEALTIAFLIMFTVLAFVGYPVAIETATRGRSVGKIVMGLRVVSDDGGPERFRQALFRALASVVEIWMLLGSPAVICSMVSPKGKRVGDMFAGTIVVSERAPRLGPPPAMPPALAWWASSLQLSGLTAGQAEVARQFLSRAPQLDPRLREQMAYRIAGDVLSRIAPPPRRAFRRSWCWPPYLPNGTAASSLGCVRLRVRPWRRCRRCRRCRRRRGRRRRRPRRHGRPSHRCTHRRRPFPGRSRKHRSPGRSSPRRPADSRRRVSYCATVAARMATSPTNSAKPTSGTAMPKRSLAVNTVAVMTNRATTGAP